MTLWSSAPEEDKSGGTEYEVITSQEFRTRVFFLPASSTVWCRNDAIFVSKPEIILSNDLERRLRRWFSWNRPVENTIGVIACHLRLLSVKAQLIIEECLNKLLSDYFFSSPPTPRWLLCSRYACPLTDTADIHLISLCHILTSAARYRLISVCAADGTERHQCHRSVPSGSGSLAVLVHASSCHLAAFWLNAN